MEIYGIGTDIIEIERIREAIHRTASFKKKVYTQKEIEYIETKKNPYASYAGRFAAKEAVSKALGTGIRGFSLSDVEIVNDVLGKPVVNLYNVLKEVAEGMKIQISISHSREYAVSTVIIYKEGRKRDEDMDKKD